MFWECLGKIVYHFFVYKQGLYIKLGQLLSTSDVNLNKNFCKQFVSLQQDVPYSINDREYRTILANIDPQIYNIRLVKAGSVAIVFKGEYKGDDVAIKVTRPNIKSILEGQYNTIVYILRILAFHRDFIKRWEITYHSLINQINIQQEIEHIDYFRNNINSYTTTPVVYHDVCTNDIIVMEWIDGESLLNITRLDDDTKKTIASQFMMFLKESCEKERVHMDLHPGNILIMPNNKLAIIDFGLVTKIDKVKGDILIQSFRGFYTQDFDMFYDNFVALYVQNSTDNLKAIIRSEIYQPYSKFSFETLHERPMSSYISELYEICDKHGVKLSYEFADFEFAYFCFNSFIAWIIELISVLVISERFFFDIGLPLR